MARPPRTTAGVDPFGARRPTPTDSGLIIKATRLVGARSRSPARGSRFHHATRNPVPLPPSVQSAFEQMFGEPLWDYLAAHPEENDWFNRHMQSQAAPLAMTAIRVAMDSASS